MTEEEEPVHKAVLTSTEQQEDHENSAVDMDLRTEEQPEKKSLDTVQQLDSEVEVQQTYPGDETTDTPSLEVQQETSNMQVKGVEQSKEITCEVPDDNEQPKREVSNPMEGFDNDFPEEVEKDAKQPQSLLIKVKLIDGTSFELKDVAQNATVEELKAMIASEIGVAVENQRIIFRGKVLQHGLLESYNLTDECWIHLVQRDPNVPQSQASSESRSSESAQTGGSTSEDHMRTLAENMLDSMVAASGLRSNREVQQAAPTAQGPARHALAPPNSDLEPLFQSMMTVSSLVNSYEESKESSADDDAKEPIYELENEEDDDDDASDTEADWEVPQLRRLERGQWIDVLDTVNQWLEATVLDVSDDGKRVLVHYNQWGERWDEVIEVRSHRIAPFRTRTKHVDTTENLSATPVSTVKTVPKIGESTLANTLPRVLEAVEKALPMLRDACSESNEDAGVVNTLYLAPTLDRLGRMLGDVAQKVAERPKLVRRKRVIPVWPFVVLGQSILPFSLQIAKPDKDKSERTGLIESRNLDADFLQLLNHTRDTNTRSSVDIHIHAFVTQPVGFPGESGTSTSRQT